MTGLLYVLFFCSGFAGLIYQVVWVRVFGTVFGNTVYSASLVIAVFMLGLGAGSYVVGAWADRRYLELDSDRVSGVLLRTYGWFELVIGLLGLGISALLPHLGQLSALVSSYSRAANGWFVLSAGSYLARATIAIVLLAPITLLMGGTLTLLIRHLVRTDFEAGGRRIAVLYGVNTAGAALGCLLTDFALVPAFGLRGTQMTAVVFNVVAGLGALWLAGAQAPRATPARSAARAKPAALRDAGTRPSTASPPSTALALTSAMLALSGFAAMGTEILWFRHFSILLGEFRAVFSLLLTVILIGIGAGSLAGGFLLRRKSAGPAARPEQWLMIVQGGFVATTLFGLATADAREIKAATVAHLAYQTAAGGLAVQSGWARTFEESWFNARPILWEVGVPALLMGFAFPLGNAVIQRAERSVGGRAGVLYCSNTIGAVCGSLAAGFLLLPAFGIQGSATILTIVAALAVVPLYMVSGGGPAATGASTRTRALAVSMLAAGVALGLWLRLPAGFVITRALVAPLANERLLTLREGVTEVVAVTEGPDSGRMLLTNGHPMSSTAAFSQRYMRALAHIPLLSIDSPESVLVMCFGVGNTAHAATLHPSVRRVEVVDLSRDVLAHAGYFSETNKDVLKDRRVAVYVNDGRHHLQMQPPSSYDLITLEPPPIAQVGMAALYSKEFYELARTRLKPGGYVSQWLPVAQVSEATALSMVRAFVDVFPNSVLVSGALANLLLIGTSDARIEIDPERVAAALSRAPAVQADLQRLDLGSVREIVGTFVGSPGLLAQAARNSEPAVDDRPMQEYNVRSLLNVSQAPPNVIVDVSQVESWCPKCFVDGKPVPLAGGLDTYLTLLNLVYKGSGGGPSPATIVPKGGRRVIAGSAYLGAIVPESVELHTLLGRTLANAGRVEESIGEYRRALQLDPGNGPAHYELATSLLEARRYEEAAEQFQAALRLMPNSVEAHNNLGVTFALQGKLDGAIDQFQQALALEPGFADARRNLADATRQRPGTGK